MSPRLKARVSGAWITTDKAGAVRLSGSTIPFGPSDPDPGDQTIFGAEVPANTAEDGFALSQGVRFKSSHAGVITAGRWWCGASPPTAAKAAIYRESDQTQLGSATFGTLTGLSWNTVNFAPSITIAAETWYRAVCWTANRYPYTGSYPWPHTSGDLTATGAYFTAAADLAYPTTATSLNFFCDLTFHRT